MVFSKADERIKLKAARKRVRALGREAREVARRYVLVKQLRDEPLLRELQLRMLVQTADLVTLKDFERQLEALVVMLEQRGKEIEKARKVAEARAKAKAEAEATLDEEAKSNAAKAAE